MEISHYENEFELKQLEEDFESVKESWFSKVHFAMTPESYRMQEIALAKRALTLSETVLILYDQEAEVILSEKMKLEEELDSLNCSL